MLDHLASRSIVTKDRTRLHGASLLEERFLRVDGDGAAHGTTHTLLTQRTRRTHRDGEMKGPTAFPAPP